MLPAVFDAASAAAIRKEMLDTLALRPTRIQVDFAQVGQLNATGLALLAAFVQAANAAGAAQAIEVCGISSTVTSILQLAGLAGFVWAEPLSEQRMSQDATPSHRFIVEAREHLAAMSSAMIALERNQGDPHAVIEQLLRAAHSIKGGAGFIGRRNIERLAHAMEEALEHIRDGMVPATQKLWTRCSRSWTD
jgi:anti-anti-sigma regulatory factor